MKGKLFVHLVNFFFDFTMKQIKFNIMYKFNDKVDLVQFTFTCSKLWPKINPNFETSLKIEHYHWSISNLCSGTSNQIIVFQVCQSVCHITSIGGALV